MLKKFVLLSGCAVSIMAFAGCFWNRGEAVVRTNYDLPLKKDISACALPVRLGVVRNYSGSGKDFIIRRSGDKIVQDEERCWLLTPEMMLEREFRLNFLCSSSGDKLITVNATICNFELSSDGEFFNMVLVYQLRNRDMQKNVLSEQHIRIGEKGAAAAVSEGFSRSFKDVVKTLADFPGVKIKFLNAGGDK